MTLVTKYTRLVKTYLVINDLSNERVITWVVDTLIFPNERDVESQGSSGHYIIVVLIFYICLHTSYELSFPYSTLICKFGYFLAKYLLIHSPLF